MKQVLILNYHLLDTANRKEVTDLERLYLMRYTDFKKQMGLLVEKNIPLVSLSDLFNCTIQHDFSIAITFDDGNSTDYPDAFPLMKQLGIPATFFISLHNIERGHITWEQIRELADNGYEIGSHGITHADLTLLNYEQALNELKWSKECIEEQLNKPVSFFSLPFGRSSDALIKAAKDCGYKALFTTNFALNPLDEANYIFHRWSVKPTTSIDEFERIISFDPSFLSKKMRASKRKKYLMQLMGSSLTNKLNVFIHSSKNQL